VSKLLINEPPLMVLPSLAKAIGLNEAIFVQQIYFWMHNATTAPMMPRWAKQDDDGRVWIRGGFDEWGRRNFPFWHSDSIRKIAGRCEEEGVLLSAKLGENSFDQTKWYTVDEGYFIRIDPDDGSGSHPDDGSGCSILEDIEEEEEGKKISFAKAKGNKGKSKKQTAAVTEDTNAYPNLPFVSEEKPTLTVKGNKNPKTFKSAAATPADRQPTAQQIMFQAVCDAAGFDPKTCNAGQVAQMVGKLTKGGYTPEDVKRWRTEFWPNSFPGNQPSKPSPTLNQIGNLIGAIRATAQAQSANQQALMEFFA